MFCHNVGERIGRSMENSLRRPSWNRPNNCSTWRSKWADESHKLVGASDFWPTVAGAAALARMHRLTGMAGVRWPWIEQLVDGRERELVRAGQVDETELRKALVTRHDLREAIRRKTGNDDLARVDKVILEPSGEITVLVKS